MSLEQRLTQFLARRAAQGALRRPANKQHLVDFSSNDYLSLARLPLALPDLPLAGSTGSRLLSGHYTQLDELETLLCTVHRGEAALVFNSGYSANLSLLGTLPRRSDVVLYDALIHASMHDGLRLSPATAFAFAHNDLQDLEVQLNAHVGKTIFVAVESVYSMDGDQAPLVDLVALCERYGAYLMVDEAHSTGWCGPAGGGLCVQLGLAERVFARLYTFGKAIGAHGAAVVGSTLLRDYLINFARPLIYTTAPSPHTIQRVHAIYQHLQHEGDRLAQALQARIHYFKTTLQEAELPYVLLPSDSPIQCMVVPGNAAVVACSQYLEGAGLDVRPIRRPTVASGSERLRICLHTHNTWAELDVLAERLQAFSRLARQELGLRPDA